MNKMGWAFAGLLFASALTASAAPFKDGDRVVFFGDSITHGGHYGEYMNLFYATRYPERNIRFTNSGWSGGSATTALMSVEDDVVKKKPTVVTLMYGMNDVRRSLWERGKDTEKAVAARMQARETYRTLMTNLVDRLRREAGNPEIVYFTPSPYDQTCVVDGSRGEFHPNDGLELFAEDVRGWARKDGATCVDLQTVMAGINVREQLADPGYSLIRRSYVSGAAFDRVHPGPVGHLVMTYAILKAQGVEGCVDTIVRDAKGADALDFEATEKSLPFPVTDAMRPALKLVDFTRDFGRETLIVSNLQKGTYRLEIDGAVVGRWPHFSLAAGIDLSLNPLTPQYRQAQAAAEINNRLWKDEKTIRDCVTSRRWAKLGEKKDPDAPGFFEKKIAALEAAGKKWSYHWNVYTSYLVEWPRFDETVARTERLRAELRAAVQPRPHRYRLVREEKPLAVFGEEYLRHWSPALNAEIDANIERFRKADYTPAVDAPDGTVVAVEQLDHAFQFGCNIFNFNQLGDDAQDAEYKAAFCKGGLFNAATVPFYWRDMESECGRVRFTSGPRDEPAFWKRYLAEHKGEVIRHGGDTPCEWRRPAPDRVLAFCASNNVAVHGHAIIYPSYRIKWLQQRVKSEADMARFMKRRIADLASYYADAVPQWDVVNESVDRDSPVDDPNDAVCWGEHVKGGSHIFLPKDYTLMCFKSAEDLFPPSVKLCINESWPVRGVYPPFVAKLLRQGAKIDVIGLQRHQFDPSWAYLMAQGLDTPPRRHSWFPEEQNRHYRALAAFGRPIHVSEITIPAPRGIAGLTDEQADAMQARMMRDNYRLWFSWPLCYRISYWNLVDGIGGEILYSGFYNRDMTKKAAYRALHDLIWKEWMTKTTTKVKGGKVAFRGFRGKYRLTWKDAAGKTVTRDL